MKIWLIYYYVGMELGSINIHGCQPNLRNGHLSNKISSFTIAIVRHCKAKINEMSLQSSVIYLLSR